MKTGGIPAPRDAVVELLSRTLTKDGTPLALPVDVERICDMLHIHVRVEPLRHGIDAMLSQPGPTITVPQYENQPPSELNPYQRFVIAHMLGHVALHPESDWSIENGLLEARRGDIQPNPTGNPWNTPEEQWASEFAWDLLTPPALVIHRMRERVPFDDMCREFGMFHDMMNRRIEQLGG